MEIVTTPPRIRRRPSNVHKGRAGRVLVIGGSRFMSGAPVLAARGALRAGAGLVRVAVPQSIHTIAASMMPEVMTMALRETTSGGLAPSAMETLRDPLAWADAVVVGPGCAQDEQTFELLREIVNTCPSSVVLDADGLNAWAGQLATLKSPAKTLVLTPHEGEAARLLQRHARDVETDRTGAALALATGSGTLAVLKGPGTLVTDGRRMYRNGSGGPVLACAGSGDVLAGVVAAFLAAEEPEQPFNGVCAAVFVHGVAGAVAAARVSGRGANGEPVDRGVLSSEIADGVPEALSQLLEEAGTLHDE